MDPMLLDREEVYLTSNFSHKNIEIFSEVDGQKVSVAISNLCLVSEFLRKVINTSMDCFNIWSDLAIILPFPVAIIEKLKHLFETGECICAPQSEISLKEALSLLKVKEDWIFDSFNPQLPPQRAKDQVINELNVKSKDLLGSQYKPRTDKLLTLCQSLVMDYERVITRSDSKVQTRDSRNRGLYRRNGDNDEILSQDFNLIENTSIKVHMDSNLDEASLGNDKLQPELLVQDIVCELVSNSIEYSYGGKTPFQRFRTHLPDSNPLEIASAAIPEILADVHREEAHGDDISNHACWIQEIAYDLVSNVAASKFNSQTPMMTRRQKRIFYLESLKSRMSLKYKLSLEISPEVKVLVKRISEAEILKNTAKKQESDCRSKKTKGNSKNLSV